MFQIPVDLALDFTRQLIVAKLGHEPTGPPITLDRIREQSIDVPVGILDSELTRLVLKVAFQRIQDG